MVAERRSAAVPGRTFTRLVADLQQQMHRSGVDFADMRGADSLELIFAGAASRAVLEPSQAALEITPLEGRATIGSAGVPWPASSTSRLGCFLDGSQRTLRVWRLGLVPIIATIAAAGILQRDDRGAAKLLPRTLRLQHTWLIPRRTGNSQVDALIARLDDTGSEIVDPLAQWAETADYAAMANDYGRMIEAAYTAARDVRARLEIELLDQWPDRLESVPDNCWLVVDGRLRLAVPRALGLVKDITNQHLQGADALELFNLRPGHRTTAFYPSDRRRSTEVATIAPEATGEHRPTLWYLRMRSPEGQDARHALIRVEAPHDMSDSEQIDTLSGWLLAERSPRPTADARWDTLLYPVHYLERILKNHVAGTTRGWPGAH